MFCPSCGKEIPDNSSFCLGCGKAIHVVAQSAASTGGQTFSPEGERESLRKPTSTLSIGSSVLIAAIAIAVLAGMIFNNRKSSRVADQPDSTVSTPVAPAPVYIPRIQPLLSSQVVVPHGGMYSVPFTVDTDRMRSVRVIGRYQASGGTGNDIQVFITDPDGFANLQNGHQAKVWYQTGKVTVGEVNVPISAPGSFVLLLNNKFSAFSDKYVNGDVELRYEEKQ